MKEVDFYGLPRPVQDRLLDSLGGRFEPRPLLHQLGTRSTALGWMGVAAAAAIVVAIVAAVGLGNAQSSLALHPLPVVAVYALLLSTVAVGLLSALQLKSRIGDLPFKPGIYLYDSALIDARQDRFRVYALDTLTRVQIGPPGKVTLSFGSNQFTLPLADPARAREAVELIEATKTRLATLDTKARFEIDPLEPPAVISPLAPTTPRGRKAPLWESQRWVLGLAVGCALGGVLFWLRNTASDNRMLGAAQVENTVAGYQAYLSRGKRHRELVADVLLPRALLRQAVEAGTVAAIDTFIHDNPKTGIQPEVDAARTNAMAAELERAKAPGTLSALLDFADAHPDHGLKEVFEQARHAAFLRARARFKQEMAEGAAEQVEFVNRLLEYAEKVGAKKTAQGYRGPTVEIRFQRLASKTLGRADSAIRKNPMFSGAPSYPAQYFQPKRMEPHELVMARALAERFAKVFEPEILTFAPGAPLDGESEDTPPVTNPSLFITHRLEWSGGAIARDKPRGVFIGLLLFFRSAFVIPGDDRALKFKYTAGENVSLELIAKHADKPSAGALEAAVYSSMTDSSFEQFRSRYLAKWFKKP
ncbi:MAG: hypothetical protein IPI67_06495 [Myxococcales bacterium]|nr:hypothetical protein [Myxococcales bacterium]